MILLIFAALKDTSMTEKEKGARGMLYDANHDEELNDEYLNASLLLVDYNRTLPIEQGMRRSILRELLGKIGKECEIRPPFYCDRGYNIELGDYVFANYHFTVLDGAKVVIGNHVYIAPNVSIYTAGHPFDVVLRRKGLEYAYPVRIGDDVWIGGGVSILPGVTIGNNVVIGAGSVVNRDIPDNSLAVGNPCKVIRRLEPSEEKELD